ncbi:hypothetical protein PIB30_055645 [Stylosanthes scabra]|uniref:Uncharacterized protein n=1 Tax=Stylosanthes scabra TaxID=79078 RepID=A0ABU6UI60_9FABA|nr:hypothetical protein [Stylosanthes scabra]
MRKESENVRKRAGVRFKGAGTVARARHGNGAGALSNGGPKMRLNGLAQTRGQKGAGARTLQWLVRELKARGRGRATTIVRTHGCARAPRKGRERATYLCCFGRMSLCSPHGRAKAIVWECEACGRAIKMVQARGGFRSWILAISDRAATPPRGSGRAITPIRLEELYHGGVSPT